MYGFGQRGEKGYKGGMGHRLINSACWMSHQGFFHGKKAESSPLVDMYIILSDKIFKNKSSLNHC